MWSPGDRFYGPGRRDAEKMKRLPETEAFPRLDGKRRRAPLSPKERAGRTAFGGLLAAIALIFSYVEVLIPFDFGIPGIKLGFANIAVLLALYTVGPGAALLVNLIRIGAAALLFGSLYSALYSLAGGLLSFAAMALLLRSGRFRPAGVSMGGGFFHNLGQILVACAVSSTPGLFYYFGALGITGLLTGLLNGVIAQLALEKMPKDMLSGRLSD